MALDVAQAGWKARWQAIQPDAAYHHEWGLERYWREHFDAVGYPLTDDEETYSYEGQDYPGRVFSIAGVILWQPGGALVVGWR